MEKLKISDIDRIVVYHRYDVDKTLLIPRYAALCMREETLTLPEGLSLGMATTLMIARARECARSKDSGSRSPTPADLDAESMHDLIKDIFGIASVASVPAPDAAAASSSTAQTETQTADGTFSQSGGSVVCYHPNHIPSLTDLVVLQETQVEVAQLEQEPKEREPTAPQPQPQPRPELNPQKQEPTEPEPQQREPTELAVQPAAEQTPTPTPILPLVPTEPPLPQEPLPPLPLQLTTRREEEVGEEEAVATTTEESDQPSIDGGEGVKESGGDVEECLGEGSGNGREGEKEGEELALEVTETVVEVVADGGESDDKTAEVVVPEKGENVVSGKEVEGIAGQVGGEANGQAEVPDQMVETRIDTNVANKDATSEPGIASNVEVQGEHTVDTEEDHQGTTEDSEGSISGTSTLIEENAENPIDNVAEDGKVAVEFQVPGENAAGELGEPPGDTVGLIDTTEPRETEPSGGEPTIGPELGHLEDSFTWDFGDTSNDNPQAGANDDMHSSSETLPTVDASEVTLQASVDNDHSNDTRQTEAQATTGDSKSPATIDLLNIGNTSNVDANNEQTEEGQTSGGTGDPIVIENANVAASAKADDHQTLEVQGANGDNSQNLIQAADATGDLIEIEIHNLPADDDESDDPNERFYDSPDWPDFPLDSIPSVLKFSFE